MLRVAPALDDGVGVATTDVAALARPGRSDEAVGRRLQVHRVNANSQNVESRFIHGEKFDLEQAIGKHGQFAGEVNAAKLNSAMEWSR